jgi:hypothetical protein
VLGADFILKVDLLLVQLILEALDLLESQGILNRHGYLVGDLLQEAQVRCVVRASVLASEPKYAKPTVRGREGGGSRRCLT